MNYNDMNMSALIAELQKHRLVSYFGPGDGRYNYLSGGHPDGTWILDCTTYGDYGGDYANKANSQSLLEQHPWLKERNEGYGSSMLYFDMDTWKCEELSDGSFAVVSKESVLELLESLDSLTDYPVLDDDLMCLLEQEAFDENWEDWGRKDFKSDLSDNCSDAHQEAIDALTDKELDKIFYETADQIGEYWRAEGSGLSVYVDTKRVAVAYLEKTAQAAC